MTAPSVAIVTLGCGRNEVDSEELRGFLEQAGYRLAAEAEDADVVVVNTCTFITPATEESIDTVLAACDLKDEGVRAVVVVGCMAQRYGDELGAALPEVDAVVGFDAYPRLAEVVGDLLAGRGVPRFVGSAVPAPPPGRRNLPLVARPPVEAAAGRDGELGRIPASGPALPVRAFDGGPWAYLKIASGCDRTCTFCAIPAWRGGFRSRPFDELTAEASWLVERGARELVLVSENTTSWGKDLPGGRDLQPELLEALCRIPRLERVRLCYLQPDELRRPLLEAMAGLPKVASYFDLSLQHVSARLLRAMARSGSSARFRALVDEIRQLDPDAVFRSNFIVGFPGETGEDVDELATFLEDARLDWVGLFAYSPQEGTRSAAFGDQVPPEVAAGRLRELTDLQERVADEAASRFVGRELDVVVESNGAEGSVGRSYREAPDTDGEVRLVVAGEAGRNGANLPVGRTVTARVTATDGVDLLAVPEHPPAGPRTRSRPLPGGRTPGWARS